MKISKLYPLATIVSLCLLSLSCWQCNAAKASNSEGLSAEDVIAMTVNISEEKPWSERMALSIMKRAPEAWMNDFAKEPRWNYTQGLVLSSIMDVAAASKEDYYFEYAKGYGDTMILADGSIRDYDIFKFNIDHIAPGPLVFKLYEKTGDERYRIAIDKLQQQLNWQPRTSEGGYWHKLRYPWQIWLDGLFMGEPFQARYAKQNNQPEVFDHIAKQFVLAEKHTKDATTGLLYHGWDESRLQAWSNPETGCSQHFWARAMGWYCMGLVDVLEHFPQDHPQRKTLIAILNRTLDAVLKVRDPETNTWWQVINYPNREGNYLESTSSCMFTYAMLKGANEGYLDEKYLKLGRESYEGILKTFIRVDDNGEIHLTSGCAVAGLGGNPYRDGSYEYYVGEPVRDNDAKGIGPFMTASIEMEKAKATSKM